ncbi:MAG: hypothetical protein H6825_07305 [Planctomycetes bacterium]|nr:hypothetical protein [Planctomycetota bacterium]
MSQRAAVRPFRLVLPAAWLLALGVLLGATGCHAPPTADVLGLRADIGHTFYLKASVFQERDRYRTTNYRRGLLVPVNTEVTLVSADNRGFVVELTESGRKLTVENVSKHTNETVGQAFETLFADRPVDLSRFSDDERSAIESGRAVPGMDKDAVLIAMGHPPYSLTPSLDADVWTYQDTQWTRIAVRFDADGRVTSVGH